MKPVSGIYLLLFIWASTHAPAQEVSSGDYRRIVYENDFSLGLHLHTRGYGISFRRGYYPTNFRKYGFETDILNLRHEKEIKTFGILPGNNRGFVLNKINSFFSLRTGMFREKILYDRYDRNGIIISWLLGGGFSIGFVKPVYIELENTESSFGQDRVLIRRYNPSEPQQNILGQAGFFQGIGETKIEPGLYVKTSFLFDYLGVDESIKSLEVGVVADAFRKEIPIFYDFVNPSVFIQLYCNINFGKRWN